MKHHKFKFPVGNMCEILGVSKSGYYNWLKSGPSKLWLENEAISIEIHTIFKESFENYGAPRIKVELFFTSPNAPKKRVVQYYPSPNQRLGFVLTSLNLLIACALICAIISSTESVTKSNFMSSLSILSFCAII